MLEHVTESLLRGLTERTIGGSDSVSLQRILDADIPNGIKTYVQAETLSWFEHDLATSPRFQRIDKTAPGALHFTTSFLVPLSSAYVFPRLEFLETLENAILFLENYLCRPQWTIHNFVFEDPKPVPREVLVAKLRYFADYAYLPQLIDRVVRRRNWLMIEPADLQDIVARIDEAVVRQHSSHELGMLLKPIFDFLNFGQLNYDQAIPVNTVLLFFEDKKMKFHREYVDSICHIRSQTTITHETLVGIIDDFSTVLAASPTPAPRNTHDLDLFSEHAASARATEASQEPETPQGPPAEPDDSSLQERYAAELPAVEETTLEGSQITIAPEENPVPEGGELETSLSEAKSDLSGEEPFPDGHESASSPENEQAASGTSETPKNPNIPLSLTFAGLQESVPMPRLPNLNLLIPEEEQNRFIRKLFKRDSVRFASVIATLNATSTWKEASLLLSRLYQEHHLDPFSPEVVRFTDAIQLRFAEEKKAGS